MLLLNRYSVGLRLKELKDNLMMDYEELKNNKKLIKDVNSNVAFLQKKFNNIVSYRNRCFTDSDIDESINNVFQNFIEIISLIPLMANIVDIPQVVRGRPNYNSEMFSKQSQISYNIERSELIEFGRFNQKFEPLFYASLPTESRNVDYVLSCALECCKELTAEHRDYKYQDITVGGWIVTNKFPVINLCFDDKHLKENPSLGLQVQKYLEVIGDAFSSEAADFIKSFLYYFADLSSTFKSCDYDYFATTALFHAIRYYYSEIVDDPKHGLIYPGAMSEKKGLNIVMTRDAARQFLILDKVVMYRYCPVFNGKVDCIAEPCSDLVYPKNGEFIITNYRVPGLQNS